MIGCKKSKIFSLIHRYLSSFALFFFMRPFPVFSVSDETRSDKWRAQQITKLHLPLSVRTRMLVSPVMICRAPAPLQRGALSVTPTACKACKLRDNYSDCIRICFPRFNPRLSRLTLNDVNIICKFGFTLHLSVFYI